MKYLIIVVLILIALPIDAVQAESTLGGFVNCEGDSCSACNLVFMINEIIKWLFGIIFVLFAVLMLVAGFGLVTSGGNQTALDAAKKKFQNAIIGIIIVMAAWLLIDTLMKGVLKGDNGEIPINGWGPWSDVQCQTQTKANEYENTQDNPVVTPPLPSGLMCPAPLITTHALPGIVWTNTDLKKCVDKFISKVGGKVTSVYRSPDYQSHLYEVSTKACQLSKISDPCTSVRSIIEGDRASHGLPLCGAVAVQNSTHSSGIGVDISGISHSNPVVQKAATDSCLIWKNYKNDPYHYDLKSGCTCN